VVASRDAAQVDAAYECLAEVIAPANAFEALLVERMALSSVRMNRYERVDRARRHVRKCRALRNWQNRQERAVEEGIKVLEMDFIKALQVIDRPLDLVFVDPPYERQDLYEACLDRFGNAPLLAPDGLLIIEHSKRKELSDLAGRIRKIRSLVQGDAALAFYRPWGDGTES